MQQWKYAKEPFDLKLFVYQCARKLHLVCLGALLGFLMIGGGYYMAKVVLAEPAPYQVVSKYYIEYDIDPQILVSYSYFAGYTWNDWVTSDEWMEPVLEKLSFDMTKEELRESVSADIESDVRIVYVTVTHPEEAKAGEIAECYHESMAAFGESQKELVEIRVLDTRGPLPESRDIRVLRACILGIVVGAFTAWFLVGFAYILDEKIYVPEQIAGRYNVPAAGFCTDDGAVSEDLPINLKYLLAQKQRIGLTAVDEELDLTCVQKQIQEVLGETQELICVPSPMQVPESAEVLRSMDGNVLLIGAGKDSGKAVESLLYFCTLQEVPITAGVLVDAKKRLINYYRFQLWRNKR